MSAFSPSLYFIISVKVIFSIFFQRPFEFHQCVYIHSVCLDYIRYSFKSSLNCLIHIAFVTRSVIILKSRAFAKMYHVFLSREMVKEHFARYILINLFDNHFHRKFSIGNQSKKKNIIADNNNNNDRTKLNDFQKHKSTKCRLAAKIVKWCEKIDEIFPKNQLSGPTAAKINWGASNKREMRKMEQKNRTERKKQL